MTDTVSYPSCTHAVCTATPAPARTVQNTYVQGLLTGVSAGGTTYGTISYYPNLLVSQIVHNNGVVDTQGNDPFSMRRPSSEGASGAHALWSSGAYSYDGAGNITRIGTSTYTYDSVSRLTAGTLFDGPTGGGTQKTQSYTFDSFGNLTNIAGTSGRATPTSSATNRLNGAGTAYDAAGNLTNWNGAVYVYDHFSQMTDMTSGSEHALYIYTVDDERVWSYDLVRNVSHWTLRDLGGKVLRDYLNNNGTWGLGSDYLYRDGLLLAAETRTGQVHYHLDHLGTPRLITTISGTQAAYHAYYPFGEEATVFNQDTVPMKFTGHERDLASPNGPGDDLDYMHARHESPVTGRFLSVDRHFGSPRFPQGWNRYTYARGNPLLLIDPTGLDVAVAASLQPAIAQAKSQSQAFKALFDRLNSDHKFHISLVTVPNIPGGTRGISSNPFPSHGPGGQIVVISGTTKVSTDPKAQVTHEFPALMGHELAHYAEIEDTGHTAKERAEMGDKKAWQNGKDSYETQDAIDVENQIRKEVNAPKTPATPAGVPQGIQDFFNSNFDFWHFGPG